MKERERALARWSCLPILGSKENSPISSGNASPVSSGPSAGERQLVHQSQVRARNLPLLGIFRDPSTKFSTNYSHTIKRNEFLTYIQNHDFSRILSTTNNKRAVSVPRNSLKFIDLSWAGYIKSIKISYKALMLKV